MLLGLALLDDFGVAGLCLALEQFPLARNAPSISGDVAISPDNAMARNGHRDMICAASLGNCAHGLR